MLKTRTVFASININFVNGFVGGNMLRAFGSLRIFICNYVLYSFGLIFSFILRFLKEGHGEKELTKPPAQGDDAERSQVDSAIDGFREELANFLFWSDAHEGFEDREGKTECSVFMETASDVPKDSETENIDAEKQCFVFKDILSDTHSDSEKTEVNAENTVLKEVESDIPEDGVGVDRRTEEVEDGSLWMKSDSAIHEDGKENGVETEGFVFIETDSSVRQSAGNIDEDKTVTSDVNENGKKIYEDETDCSVLMQSGSDLHAKDEADCCVFRQRGSNVDDDTKKEEGDEEREGPVIMEIGTATTTSKCEYMSGKDVISGFIEEPTTMSFTFREFYMGPDVSVASDNACANTVIIADKEYLDVVSEKDPTALEEKNELVQDQEHVSITRSTPDIPFRFESEAFGGTGTDSSDEDNFLFNENSVVSDSESSESSTSSGLIWGASNMIDDSFAYQFLDGNEGFESELLKLMMKREESIEDVKEKQFPCGGKVSAENGYLEMGTAVKDLKSLNAHGFGDKDQKHGSLHEEVACRKENSEGTKREEGLAESDSDDEDLEWEHDDLVEQLKMELRNARQGGLATILEEEEEEEEVEKEEQQTESPKVVEDLKPLKIEKKLEFEDQIDEIDKFYKCYAEKMRKLDILNYQTMHALGLLQVKDPLKLISIPKSTIPSAKPVITQNLWPRKASKITSDPLLKLVHELHRDLELVYVGQVCLSWEILCWQHKKAQELQEYDSQVSHRYNHVAGEFQLFQVLMQRFIENEPFQQGTRTHNYVKNRCVIRNLLQVPAIKDDSMKDKNITIGDEEDAIASGNLAELIKESMRVFWEFVRADKDYGNVILKASQQLGTDLKDPAISGLLVDIKSQLQKKEKKLKDIVRSGNCIVKKFQKNHEDQLDHEQLVAQVGLRLISRVLSMSKLRKEQLIWCHEKLHRIKFLSRKIVQVEPSFWLFPS